MGGLVALGHQKPDVEIENYFYHELTPYLIELFQDSEMSTIKKKSALKHFLSEGVKPSENTDSEIIADESALLQSYNWIKGEKHSFMAFTGSPPNCSLERFEQRQLRTIGLGMENWKLKLHCV